MVVLFLSPAALEIDNTKHKHTHTIEPSQISLQIGWLVGWATLQHRIAHRYVSDEPTKALRCWQVFGACGKSTQMALQSSG